MSIDQLLSGESLYGKLLSGKSLYGKLLSGKYSLCMASFCLKHIKDVPVRMRVSSGMLPHL